MRALKFFLPLLLILTFIFYGYQTYHNVSGRKVQPIVPRSIYLITATGLRPDHLTSYLYQHGQTTELDYLAYDGIRFINAYSTSSDSLPAHLSLLTGLYPFSKGVRETLDFAEGFGATMPAELPSLPKWFAQRRYKTAAIISDPELRSPTLWNSLFQEAIYGDRILTSWQAAYTPFEASSRARDWIENHRGVPHFLWVNFAEPTLPFEPPPPYDHQYAHHPYDGEIAALDEQIGRLLHYLKESGVFKNSIVVVAAPYGESLDHERRTGSVSPSILRIPLMIAAPGLLPVHQEYNHPASLIDVFPTILTLLDQKSSAEPDGIPLFKKGTSEEIVREFIFAETRVPLRFGFTPAYFVTTGGSYYETGDGKGEPRLRPMLEGKVGKLPASDKPAPSPDVSPGAVLEEATLLAKTGHPDWAFDLIASFSDILPQPTVPLLSMKAEFAAAASDFTKARSLYEHACKASQNPQLLAATSRMEFLAGNFSRAFTLQQQINRLSYVDYSITGIAAFHLGKYATAISELTQALEKNDRLGEAYLYRGLAFQKEKRHREAQADFAHAADYFKSLLERNAKDYGSMIELAALEEAKGNDQMARKLCEQVLIYADDPELRSKAREIIAR